MYSYQYQNCNKNNKENKLIQYIMSQTLNEKLIFNIFNSIY